jgi:hypothetical protein
MSDVGWVQWWQSIINSLTARTTEKRHKRVPFLVASFGRIDCLLAEPAALSMLLARCCVSGKYLEFEFVGEASIEPNYMLELLFMG